ncbi:single-stranded-DNA-specific exonuclease RecJ [Anaeromicrobium sediminis]|uniref:Single-stranded-DNA-specific exonuclease RecJ n=1 Tax=Anaeromicrobium sediminis TaxID=1478221 RepID=A0A267MGR7_9FIRM|nr:single-stranded-DNA-specific exonuclease RecJ [Anaeromicrobium sediminis]PAB58774.1 single-stranded-DNA-specific exonuclease RecJ [Anaeromicrobium sediminis]
MFETTWQVLNKEDINNIDTDEIIKNILKNKGILEEEQIKEFLSDKPQRTYDPFLLKDMKEAVEKIVNHIENKKSIWIYGDYDVDGITSISLLMDFLSNFTDNLNYYIPLREEEGYGLNCDAIRDIKEKGADLIITVDCGSTSINEVSLAKELGMDIIITDHHNIGEEKPDCLIVNPKQEDCEYPFELLCGCGIAFKLAQAIQKRLDGPKKYLAQVLDLVALGTVADVVPLVDENRTMLKHGLNRINKGSRTGLKTLIDKIELKLGTITSTNIAFIIAPHFNASGRIDDAKASVRLLLSEDMDEINSLVSHLIECNNARKELQVTCIEKCKNIVEENYTDDLFLVVNSEDGHEGVIGIVAGKVRDAYYKPALILTGSSEDGILKGSGRSIEHIDIYEELKKHEDLFVKFGGHKNACGFSIKSENLDLLREKLNEEASKKDKEIFVKRIKIDCELMPSQITLEMIEKLKSIEPYGMGNEKPKFLISDAYVNNPYEYRFMGKEKKHIKLKIKSNKYNDNTKLDLVGFNMADRYMNKLNGTNQVQVVGFPDVNHWNGNVYIQFKIEDIKE